VLALKEDKNAVETQGRWRVVSASYSTWRTWRVFNLKLNRINLNINKMNGSKESTEGQCTEKQTLKNSLEKLNQRNYELSDIALLSSELAEKFFYPHNEPKDNAVLVKEEEVLPDNIVEVFDGVSRRLGNNINHIGHNLQRILSMIG
jgi:hypothetical protein